MLYLLVLAVTKARDYRTSREMNDRHYNASK